MWSLLYKNSSLFSRHKYPKLHQNNSVYSYREASLIPLFSSSFKSESNLGKDIDNLKSIDECLSYFTDKRTLFKPTDFVSLSKKILSYSYPCRNKINSHEAFYSKTTESSESHHFAKTEHFYTTSYIHNLNKNDLSILDTPSISAMRPFFSPSNQEHINRNERDSESENGDSTNNGEQSFTIASHTRNSTMLYKHENLHSPKKCFSFSQRKQAKANTIKYLYRKRSFINLIKDAIFQIDRFKGEELLQFCQIIFSLNPAEKLPLQASVQPFLTILPTFSSNQLVQTATLYSHARLTNMNICQSIFSLSDQKKDNFSSSDLASLCEAAAKFTYKPVQILRNLLGTILSKIDYFTPRELSLILYAYVKQKNACDNQDIITIFKSLLQQKNNWDKLHIPVLLRITWAASTFPNPYTLECLKQIEQIILPQISYLDPRGLATLIWAYSTMNTGSYSFYLSLKAAFLNSYRHMTIKGLTNSLYGLSQQLSRIVQSNGSLDTLFLDEVEGFLIDIMPSFNERDLSRLAFAYSHGCTGSHLFYASLQIACLQKSSFSSNELTDILYAFALAREGRKVFSRLHVSVLEMLNLFSVYEICDICWSFAVSKMNEILLWEALFSALPKTNLLMNQRCALLFPAINEARILSPEVRFENLEIMKIYTRDSFWNLQLVDFPQKFAFEIQEAIRYFDDTYYIKVCQDYEGYLVDVMIEKDSKEKAIAILCLTSLNYHRNIGRPMGGITLKYRYLNRCGLNIICISWDDWKKHSNIKEQSNFISSLFSRQIRNST